MKGIFIPEEILNINELNFEEKGLLAIYKYYTEEGDMKCCSITNSRLQEILGIKRTSFHNNKKHLKELGLITTNGGIEVKYNSPNIEPPSPNTELYSPNTEPPCPNIEPPCPNTELYSPNIGPIIKKEKEIKKELIKDNKDLIKDEVADEVEEEQVKYNRTNWDIVKQLLPGTYNFTTGIEDKIEFIERTEMEFINHINKFYDHDKNVMTNAIQSWVRLCSNIITEKYNKDNKVSDKKQTTSNLRKSFFSLDDM